MISPLLKRQVILLPTIPGGNFSSEGNAACTGLLKGVIDTISGKWGLVIIHAPVNRPRLQFGRLAKELFGISPRTRTDTLVTLRKEGFAGKGAFFGIPRGSGFPDR